MIKNCQHICFIKALFYKSTSDIPVYSPVGGFYIFCRNIFFKANWPIVEISKALGHKNIATTENYLHVTPREIEDAQDIYLKNNTSGVNVSDFL